ncbi:site-specific DNA-methyltransferase [Heyndrickxia faecalis]|uniref:site-specific DNA-methyltransferase n=1 Tax=Heyndrickxia TaxID=2837504 RepID=UPI002E1C01A0|nr:site-specific DNA-methyltransferase [Weizmannia sp. CD-2023]
METNLQKEIKAVLSAFPEYWDGEQLLKSKVIEDVRRYRADLMEALFSNPEIKDAYSVQIGNGLIFKTDEFVGMLRFKNYWQNSYTRFSNEVGLASEGKYLRYDSDVVLDFPHKDCVLEGGMTKEDVGRSEVYYHNVLAREEIDVMLSPKVLTNVKKYDAEGEHEVNEITEKDNLIIKGNNLIALYSLKEKFSNSVKGIFIDPPYFFYKNKNDDSFRYNSNFKLSTWLTFMKNRLEIAKELLSEDGVIAVVIGIDGYAYLKVLMDQIFEVNTDYKRYIGTITWRKTDNQSNIGDFANVIDYILLYRKNGNTKLNLLPLTEKAKKEYSYTDKNGEKYRRSNILDLTRGRYTYEVTTPDGGKLYGPWMIDEYEYSKLQENDEIHWPSKGKQIPYGKIYLKDTIEKGQITSDFWDGSYGTNQRSADEIKELFGNRVFEYAKPEKLVQNVISLITNKNDIILDFFMGSATTQAVAMKMNRRFIGIEQMDYIETVSVPRLRKVIEGEQGGISKDVGWQGGGSFIYAELQELNMKYVHLIQAVENEDALNNVMEQLNESAYLNFKADLEKLTNENSRFCELSLNEKKRLLIEVLDHNQLYLSYSEIDDSKFGVPESVKQFNRSFYESDGEEA